jgi:hypothetical protein
MTNSPDPSDAQRPREIEGWRADKNLVHRNGWTHIHAFACENDTQATYAAAMLTERDQHIADLEADLGRAREDLNRALEASSIAETGRLNALEENERLRERLDVHERRQRLIDEAADAIAAADAAEGGKGA